MSVTEEPTIVIEPGAAEFEADKFSWPWPIYTTELIPVTNASPAICIQEKSIEHTLDISILISAAVIIVLLNILLPRWKGKSLWSLLDLVVPVKFLDSTPFRFIYCLVMSTWAADILRNVSDGSQYYKAQNEPVLDAFNFFIISPSVIILKQTLTYFPILACVDSPVPVIGHTLGFLYTLLVGSHDVYIESMVLRGCSTKGQLPIRDMLFSVAIHCPVYVIHLITAGWFFFHAAYELPLVFCTKQKYDENMAIYSENKHYYDYVKGLLKRKWKWEPFNLRLMSARSLLNYLVHGLAFATPFHQGFSYPLPLLSAISMSLMLIYQLGLSLAYKGVSYTEQLMEHVREFNITVETVERFFPSLKPEVENLFYDAKSLILAFNIVIPLCVFITVSMVFAFILYMAQHYHKLIVTASRGDLSFLVTSEPLPSVPYRLAATMRYSAFQLAYIVFTWMVFFMMMSSLLTFGLLFYFLFKDFQTFGVHLWAWFMVPLMWSGLMHQVQVFLCHFVFIEDKHLSKNGFVPIRFKSLYQVLSILFFFFNFIYGFVMCALRVMGNMIFTVVMLFRMDWDVYMRGLEGWDVGRRTFVGYMYIECTNNNAVVRTFIALLQESVNHKRSTRALDRQHGKSNGIQHNHGHEEENDRTPLITHTTTISTNRDHGESNTLQAPRSKQARNRWFVAYTLLRNPSLQALTANSLTAGAQRLGNEHNYGTFSNSL